MTTLESKLYRAPTATWREVDGEVAIVSLDSYRVRLLNGVGSFIWKKCDGIEVGAVVGALCQQYEVEPDVAQKDVTQFVDDLVSRGMLRVEGGAT